MEKTVDALIELVESMGLASEDLDDLVHDCADHRGAIEANDCAGEADQENALDDASEDAAAINNGGLAAQVRFLAEFHGLKEAENLIRDSVQTA